MEIISGHQRAVPSVSREPDGVDGVRDYLSGLRQSINSHLLNVGVLSAFMSALAASVYVGMPHSPQCLGADAVLYELAALISDPGAPAQPFHPDTPFLDEQGVAVLTAFVALQPIDETMGPTRFLPASHTAKDHAALAEIFSTDIPNRCSSISEDLARVYKQVGLAPHL